MQPVKIIFIILLALCIQQVTCAQQEYATINGLFTEKATAEIVIIQKNAGASMVLAQCFKDQTQDCFTVRFPVTANAGYSMRVNLLKQGARRMEMNDFIVFPVKPTAGGVQAYTITPSTFDSAKQTGITIAKSAQAFSVLVINGALQHWAFGGQLTLNKVKDGQLQPVQTLTIPKDNPVFNFRVPITTEGFYYISTLGWRKRIYAKPNDSLQLNIDGSSQELTWVRTTKENELLTQWQSLIKPITAWGYERAVVNVNKLNLDSFTNSYQQLQLLISNFTTLSTGANTTFSRLLKTAMGIDNQYTALKLLYYLSARKTNGYVITPKEFNTVPGYYKEALLHNNVTTMQVMQVGEGRAYLDLLTKFSLVTLDENKRAGLSTAERLQLMIKAIPNDTLQADLLKELLAQTEVNNLREFKEVFTPLQKYATTPEAKKKYKEVYEQFIGDTAIIGKPAWNFSLPDTAGRLVSMKDFKGKVVLIDVWATWCGPCKAQFPFLKEIEDDYKNNTDVVFVGISTDKIEKKENWLNIIHTAKLGGVQLLDDFGKNFARKYGITAIPRFMLIDRQGRWIEIRCPLPESKMKLKKYLDEALESK